MNPHTVLPTDELIAALLHQLAPAGQDPDHIEIGTVLVRSTYGVHPAKYRVTGETTQSWLCREIRAHVTYKDHRVDTVTWGPDTSAFDDKVNKKTREMRGGRETCKRVTTEARYALNLEAQRLAHEIEKVARSTADLPSLAALRACALILGTTKKGS